MAQFATRRAGVDLMQQQGDIFIVTLDPVIGREQAGRRPVVVISPAAFNLIAGTPWVLPITAGGNFPRSAGFAVPLSGLGLETDGVVLCNQLRAIDLKGRKGQWIERAPQALIDEILLKLLPILE